MQTLTKLSLAAMTVAALAGCAEGAASPAGDLPRGNLRIVVSYTAGGPTDLAARAVAPCLESELDRTVVVENKPGGSGAIALKEVADAKPDGRTTAIIAVGNAVIAPMLSDVGYTYEDFAPVGGIYELPSVLLVGKDSPYRDARGLLAAAKESPGSVKVATPGSKVYDAELQRMTELYDVKVTPVPFDGTSDAVTALLGGNVDAMFSDASKNVLAQVDSGEFRALATGAAEPLPYLEGVPTLASLGYPELTQTSNLFALGVPARTPPEAVSTLADALRKCSGQQAVAEVYGAQYKPAEYTPGEEIAKQLDEAQAAFEPFLRPS